MSYIHTRALLVPSCLFLLLLLMSVAGWKLTRETLTHKSHTRFDLETSYLHEQIRTRFDTYAQVLRGGVGFFNGSDGVTRNEWYHYVKRLELSKYFPGIQGVGFATWIGDRKQLAIHEKNIRTEGFSTYAVKPAGDREAYTASIYLEPLNHRNQQAFGYDMFSDSTRRIAMERARDSGEAALSGKVELLQGISVEKLAGFLLYLPVYQDGTVAPSNIEQRRTRLTGFVYSPFRADNFMKGILQQGLSTISFQIYDDPLLTDDSILYDGEKQLNVDRHLGLAKFRTQKTITIAGREWFIRYSSTPSFFKKTDSVLPWAVLAASILCSTLISIIAWMLLAARARVAESNNELRKQADINSVLLENLAEGVIACDADFNVTLFNRVARQLFCLRSEEEPDLQWNKRVQMFDNDGTRIELGASPLARAATGTTISSEELCIVVEGKEPRFVLATGGPLPSTHGKISGAVISLRDISDYRTAMKNIERQQNFLSDVLDSIPNLISAKNRDGGYILANKAYSESVHGMPPEELLSSTKQAPLGKVSNEDEINENIAVIETGTILSVVRKALLYNEEERWFSIGKIPIRSNRSPDYIVLTVASDITELKLSEARVRTMNQELESRVTIRTLSLEEANRQLDIARQLAEDANQAKSSFLAAMSHEIRTPMNGVVGMVEVLMNESLNADQKESLQMVLDSAFSLLGIIDDILDFSKVEAGFFELDNTEVHFSELMENIARATVPLAKKSHCSLALFVDPKIPDYLLLDVTRFRQILTNFIGNAIKFSGNQLEHQGHIEVRALLQQEDPLRVQLDFKDNGIGMSPDTLEHIFESFVQAESSITRRFGGSGLGLAICKRIVDLIGGEILVESQLGEGSVFSVRLPLQAVPSRKETSIYENIDDVSCVLLDSIDYNVADIKSYLEAAKATVYSVSDFQAAINAASLCSGPVVMLFSCEHIKQHAAETNRELIERLGHVILSREENSMGLDTRRIALSYAHGGEYVSAIVVDNNALRRKTLIDAIAISLGRASPEKMHIIIDDTIKPKLAPLSIEAAMDAGCCLLVVEDDSVNRMVIGRQLKLLGYTAEFSENGQDALEKWRKGRYALILTDLHMPIMDGYTLTQTIRQEEAPGKRLPIIALTANALSSEPKRAANAGVDDYLTKPLQLYMLKEAIQHYLLSSDNDGDNASGDVAEVHTVTDSNNSDDFQPDILQGLLGQDPEIIHECLKEFLISLAQVGHALAESIHNGDWVAVDQLSHQLKSSSSSMGALQVCTLCEAIESARIDDNSFLVKSYEEKLILAIERADAAIRHFMTTDE